MDNLNKKISYNLVLNWMITLIRRCKIQKHKKTFMKNLEILNLNKLQKKFKTKKL